MLLSLNYMSHLCFFFWALYAIAHGWSLWQFFCCYCSPSRLRPLFPCCFLHRMQPSLKCGLFLSRGIFSRRCVLGLHGEPLGLGSQFCRQVPVVWRMAWMPTAAGDHYSSKICRTALIYAFMQLFIPLSIFIIITMIIFPNDLLLLRW